jgi:two-component system, LytTR family, response regulator
MGSEPESANVEVAGETAKPVRIAIRNGGSVILMESTEVIAVEARGNHVLVRACSGSQPARESVSAVEEKLKPYGFIRIHRSTIVNEALVEEIRVFKSGVMRLRVKGTDREYAVSRRYRPLVSRLAPAWI